MIRTTFFILAIAGLAVSAPTVLSSIPDFETYVPSDLFSKAEIAAAFSPTGLNISLSTFRNIDSSVSALDEGIYFNGEGILYCETSGGSPLAIDVVVSVPIFPPIFLRV